nr:MAG TPA: hypothetical protein [Caudoviricetes sp.]
MNKVSIWSAISSTRFGSAAISQTSTQRSISSLSKSPRLTRKNSNVLYG